LSDIGLGTAVAGLSAVAGMDPGPAVVDAGVAVGGVADRRCL